MRTPSYYWLIAFCCILFACASQRTSVIVGCDYDAKNNQTTYFVLPYGSATLPGEWKKTDYNEISSQQFLVNKDLIKVAIAFTRFDKYEFNVKGDKQGMDFVEGYYEWDSNYFVNSYGLKRELIEKDKVNKYILYRIYGKYNQSDMDTFFLIGEKNRNVTNLSISITDKWSRDEKITFLKKIFVGH